MQNRKLIIRILAGVLMVASIIWGYWWLTWALAIVFLFLFPMYYEIIAWGIIYDAIYGVPLPEFYGIPYVFTISSIVLFLIAFYMRKYLTVYES